jgi:FkbM family methyltransferase
LAGRLLGRGGALAGLELWVPDHFDSILVGPEYEPGLMAALRRLVRPGFVCADVGANVGVVTIVLARDVGKLGRVVAFEAIHDNVEVLRRNLELNPKLMPRVVVEEAAVTDGASATVELFAGRGGSHAEWTISREFAARADDAPVERAGRRVRALALDDYYPSPARLDLVKMDIEGAEAVAVAGMRRLLEQTRPVVVLEFHAPVGWPAIGLLLDAGYRLESLDGVSLRAPASADDVPYQLVALPS